MSKILIRDQRFAISESIEKWRRAMNARGCHILPKCAVCDVSRACRPLCQCKTHVKMKIVDNLGMRVRDAQSETFITIRDKCAVAKRAGIYTETYGYPGYVS